MKVYAVVRIDDQGTVRDLETASTDYVFELENLEELREDGGYAVICFDLPSEFTVLKY